MKIRVSALRRLIHEAMSDDQARRRDLRKNPPEMSVTDAREEFVGMLPHDLKIDGGLTDAVAGGHDRISLVLAQRYDNAIDEIEYTLVDELGYTSLDRSMKGFSSYVRANLTVNVDVFYPDRLRGIKNDRQVTHVSFTSDD